MTTTATERAAKDRAVRSACRRLGIPAVLESPEGDRYPLLILDDAVVEEDRRRKNERDYGRHSLPEARAYERVSAFVAALFYLAPPNVTQDEIRKEIGAMVDVFHTVE